MSFVENINLIADTIKNSIVQGTDNFLKLIETPIITGASGGTGISNTNKTITLGGNLTTSGTFDTTLISTGTTNVTLPTTGILSTLYGTETLSNKTLVAPNIGIATGTSFNSITGLSSTTPNMNGVAAIGTSTTVALADHIHPKDTSKQDILVSNSNIKTVGGVSLLGSGDIVIVPYNSPTFTGTPTAPTAAARTNNAQLATTAYVDGKMVLSTTVASTSGTSIDFTGIPAWAKKITVMFNGVSTNGTSSGLVQIGSGTVVTSGYASGHGIGGSGYAGYNTTTGFGILAGASAAHVIHGHMTITLFTGNTYTSSHSTGYSDGTYNGAGGGTVTSNGVIDRIRITTVNGTDAFDAGSINIMYEG
jgi:hypothetical protein